jgi:hypothetical protein
MREGLEGETYAGRYVVADARLASPVAAGEGTVVVSPKGFVLFGPLPGDRWIIFVDIDEAHAGIADPPTSDTVAALVNERLGTDVGACTMCAGRPTSACTGGWRPCSRIVLSENYIRT